MTTTVIRIWKTTVGKKAVMAATGFILVAFVVGHLVGNLQVFGGAAKFNAYAAFLHANPGVLWAVRSFMLLTLGLALLTGALLVLQAWKSRPEAYAARRFQEAGFNSRTMRWTGPMILLFVFYHLLHLTTGTLHPDFSHVDVFGNLLVAFGSSVAGVVYIVALLGLCLHLSHGVWSMLQTVGAISSGVDKPLRLMSLGVSLFLFTGFMSIPLAVALGLFTF